MTDMPSIRATLGSQQWLRENEPSIKALLPDTWTLFDNLAGGPVTKIAFGFKLLGINWRSTDEFGQIMAYLTKIGILQRAERLPVPRKPKQYI